MGAISFLDRVNISIAGHSISQDFHLTDVQLGKVFSAFFIGYGLFQIAGGWAVDRLGPRRVLALGAAWWAAFTALTASFPAGLAQAFLIIWSVRFFLGMGESVMYPSSNRWVANWIPTAERGLANGLIFAGVGAGSAFTPPIIRYVMVHLGWRSAFWVCAVLGLAAGTAWYWMARDHPDQHSWLNDAERKRIHQGIPQADPLDAPKLSWGTMLGSKDVWALTLSYFCYG
jgi:ACS family glucarate transporter-like MFS transporter